MTSSSKKTRLVGEFIKKKRVALALSQKELGMLFNPPVTTQFISNVERGVTPLPPTHVVFLAKALSTSESEFMTLLEKEYAQKLNERLGKQGDEISGIGSGVLPSMLVSRADFDFMKNLYDAYQEADSSTKQAFATVCESILKLPKAPLGTSTSTGNSSGSTSN